MYTVHGVLVGTVVINACDFESMLLEVAAGGEGIEETKHLLASSCYIINDLII